MNQGLRGFFTVTLLILASASLLAAPAHSFLCNLDEFPCLFDNVTSNDSIVPGSDAGPDEQVFYDASDSTVMDVSNQRIFLYNDAVVKYGNIELRAGYIEFSFSDFTAKARGIPDSAGVLQKKPIIIESGNELTEDSLAYNFKTKRGISYGVRTQQGDAYLISKISKRQSNEWIHIKGGMLTTCDNENPHYHFKLSKAIVVPDDKVVSGPLYMKVGKIPTPLALPFGFFPNKQESTHGILLPGYGNHDTKGYFFNNFGYYIPLPPYLETKFLFDIYTRGSWRIANNTSYKRIYKYSGNFDISRISNISGIRETSTYAKTTEFALVWNHRQDSKARPGSNFNANVRLGSRNNYRNNLFSSQQDFLSSTFNSTIQWSKSWQNKRNLGISARHSQNTSTGQVDVTLPSMSFTVSRFMPLAAFRNDDVIGPKRWFEQIGVTYSADFDNLLSDGDTAYNFRNLNRLIRKTSNGIRQGVNASTAIKIFRGIVSLNPTASYDEYWGFKTNKYTFDEEGNLITDTIGQFISGRNWNVSASANTRIYATYTLKRGNWLKAIRHVVFPAVGLGYTPYYNRDEFGYFGNNFSSGSWNPFDLSRFRPSNTNEAASLNFSIKQNLEAKFKDRKSTKISYKKVVLIDQFNISSRFNMIADSLKWSNVSMAGNTTVLKKYSLSYRSSYSLYDRDSAGREINTFLVDSQNKLARMETTNLSLELPLSSSGEVNPTETISNAEGETENKKEKFSIPWNLHIGYNISVAKQFEVETQVDKSVVTQGLTFRGDFTLFARWTVGIDSGYDFELKEFTPTVINLRWDLHCWELKATWIPTGIRKSYMVQLNVKSPILQDLKLQRRGQYGNETLLY